MSLSFLSAVRRFPVFLPSAKPAASAFRRSTASLFTAARHTPLPALLLPPVRFACLASGRANAAMPLPSHPMPDR